MWIISRCSSWSHVFFLKELGCFIQTETGEPLKSTDLILQCLFMAVQFGNCILEIDTTFA